MQEAIKAALAKLDPENEDHWTSEGLPRVEAVRAASGVNEITRQDITNAAPEFSRVTMTVEPEQPELPLDPDLASDETEGEEGETHADLADEDVLAMPPSVVFQSVELCEKAIRAYAARAEKLASERDAIAEKIKETGARSELCSTMLARLQRGTSAVEAKRQKSVTDYLESQKKSRADRAARVRRIVGDSGVSPKELQRALQTGSDLDSALKSKRPTSNPGGQAPATA